MGLRTLAYHLKHAFLDILSNRLVHLISIGTISVSVLLFGSFILLFLNLDNWIMNWGQSFSMSIYVKDEIDQKTKENIEAHLRALPGAELKGFVSKEEAMTDLMQGLGEQSGLLEGLTSNPLPASFEIIFKDVNIHKIDPRKMKQNLEKIKGVQEVQYSEQWLERFKGIMSIFKIVGFVIGGLLCLAVLFITTNTIKLIIYSRQDEIAILKLVGATDWFIKAPFLMEGVIQGLIAAVIALGSLFIMYHVFALKKIRLPGLPVLEFVFLPGGYLIFILSLGLFLGLIGSLIAVRRFVD